MLARTEKPCEIPRDVLNDIDLITLKIMDEHGKCTSFKLNSERKKAIKEVT